MQIKTECELYEALARGTTTFRIVPTSGSRYIKTDCYLKGDKLWGVSSNGNGAATPVSFSTLFSIIDPWEIRTTEPLSVQLGQVFKINEMEQAVVTGFTEEHIFAAVVPNRPDGWRGCMAPLHSFCRETLRSTADEALELCPE